MSRLRTFVGRLWPKRLMGQTVLLVLLAMFSAQVISALIIRSEARDFYRGAETRFLAERIAPFAALMRDTPAELRPKLADAMSGRRLRVWIGDAAVAPAAPGREQDDDDSDDARELAARIAAEIGMIHAKHIRVFRRHHEDDEHHHSAALMMGVMRSAGLSTLPDDNRTVIAIDLGSAQWMNAALQSRPPRRLIRTDAWITFFITALAISIIVVFALRRITRPLGALSDAAGKLGRGEDVAPLAEEGPADLKEAIRAFNDMQTRLKTFITERTRMLAAVSHDLRTPITALRLRAEMLDDPDARERMIETLSDMQDMIEATLAFARGDAADEPTRPTDLGALLGAVADDLRDLGRAVDVSPSPSLIYPCRALSLRRALTNLIDNAAGYGERAHASLTEQGGAPVFVIEDDGPGIPETEMSRIFEPFVRLDASRSAETGGSGLGLSIARDIVHRHGGDIALENMAQGGLRVTVTLPVVQS